ncbi:MAG: glycerol-3-phosphate acyltransferase [Myxococcota bacterium]
MSPLVSTGLLVGAAYLSGAVPYGHLIARARGIDIRAVGSGNIGATNVSRALGRGWGVVVLVLDALKGAVPVGIAVWTAGAGLTSPLGVTAAGLAAVVGHCFPVWLAFRGGKGVATSLGVFLVIDPVAAAASAVVFFATYALTRTASVGSLVAATLFPVILWA